MRFFDLRTDRSRCKQNERTTSPVLGRHYRVFPQRLVADSLNERSERCICGAKPPSHSNRTATLPVTEHTPEGVWTAPSLTDGASPSGNEAGWLEASDERLCRTSAEAGVRHGPLPQVAASSERRRNELHQTRAEARERCFLEASKEAEASVLATKLPCWKDTAEAMNVREGSFGFRGAGQLTEVRWSPDRPPERCLPPVGHRSGTQAQDAQREVDDTSHGVRFLSAFEPRRSLCRFASSTPSAHRVSHSLSGLSPPGPRGFVSRHIRP